MTMSLNGLGRFQCKFPLLQLVFALRVGRPSDMSAIICIEVYASFEFEPMLGVGEQLRELTATVGQLLERNEKDIRELGEVLYMGLGTDTITAFSLSPKDGDVVSSCSSILVTTKRQKCGNGDSSMSRVVDPQCVSRRTVSRRPH